MRAAWVALVTLLIPWAVALPTQAAPTDDAQAASANTAWLVKQLDGGKLADPMNPAMTDYGVMIDILLAAYASGDGKLAAPIVKVLDEGKEGKNYFTYAGVYDSIDDPSKDDWIKNKGLDDRVGGATAKVLVAALAAGRNPRSFGGYDMVEETRAVLTPDGPEKGRVRDFGPTITYNNSNTFGQALAVLGLAGAGANDTSAITMLTRQQCSEGHFRIFYSADAQTGTPETCDQGKASDQAAPDRDSTGFAVSAMIAAKKAGATGLDDNITRAVNFLTKQQTAGGGWGGGVSTEAPNTNSTGLVVQALADGGASDQAIRRGADYVRSAQVTQADSPALTEHVGAIAYTPAEYEGSRGSGIANVSSWIRASAQASLALSRASFWDVVKHQVPQGGTAPSPTPTPTGSPSPTSPPASSSAPATRPTTGPSSAAATGPGSDAGSRPGDSAAGRPAPPRSVPSQPPAAASVLRQTEPGRRVGLPAPPPRSTVPGGMSAPSILSPKAPAPTVQPGSATPAGRLARQIASSLVDGDHVEVTQGGATYVDYDATANAVLALRALNEQPTTALKASRFLLDPKSVRAYANGAPYEKSAATYVEPTAKLLILTNMLQRQRISLPDLDRTARSLTAALAQAQGSDGTFEDSGSYPDRSDTVRRHAWAGLAVTGAGDTAASGRAAQALIGRQCSDGGFAASLAQPRCARGDSASSGSAALLLNAVQAPSGAPTAAPVVAPASAKLPRGWTAERLTALRKVGTHLSSRLSSGVVRGGGNQVDLAATAATASGQQMLGLDTTDTVRAVSTLVDGSGLIRSAGIPATPASAVLSSPAVAGRSWTGIAMSPVARGVAVPALAQDANAGPPQGNPLAPGPTSAQDAWWQSLWPYVLTGLAALTVGLLLRPRPGRAGQSHPTQEGQS